MTHSRWPRRFVLLATTLLLVTVGPPVADANGHLIVADQQAFRGGVSDERVTISATDNTATEAGRTTGRFTLTRTGSTALPLTVHYTVGGTAIGGKDYVALPGHRTIPAGSATATIIVTPINDRLMERTETVVLQLAPGPYRVGVPSHATVRLVSDERVTISATDNTATEAGRTTGRFTLTRTGSTALPLTVRYTVGGTAIGGKDYVALPGHRTIPAGSATATIIVTPINDRLMERTETVVLQLAPGPYRVGVPSHATVRLVSDERVTISATDNTATEAGRTTGRFTLTRTGSTALPLTVRYTVGGTAIGGKDYVALPGRRTIPAGSATATIIVTPINDRLMERTETVVLQLAPGPYRVGVPSHATVRLIDDARVIYVANNGFDSATCGDRDSPCRSVSQGISNADTGDRIVVGPGRYGDLNGNGVFGEPGEEFAQGVGMITVDKSVEIISSDGPLATTLDATSPTRKAAVLIAASGVTLGRFGHGFLITGAGFNGVSCFSFVSNATVEGNVAQANGQSGIAISGSGNLVEGNIANGNGAAGFGIFGTANVVRHNAASRNGAKRGQGDSS